MKLLTILLLFPLAALAQSPTARQMAKAGYTDVQSLDKTIEVSLMYARADNFTGGVLYDDLREAYLHPTAARALAKASRLLQKERPDLRLRVYDAARPMTIQQKMWDKVKQTDHSFYVSNPAHGGGLHNYGFAVDITIARAGGDTLAMGTRIDAMTSLSHIDREDDLRARHKLTREAVANRRLLRRIMRQAGWKPLRTEWWHFNLITRTEAKRSYKPIK